jgi:outer membrane lipoprotein SlyB
MVKSLLVPAVGCALLLQGCASSESASFTKHSVSAAVAQRDAEQCWQDAQRRKVPEDKASENTTTAFVVGGLVGVAINRSANEDAYRGRVRDECMAKRGYKSKAG